MDKVKAINIIEDLKKIYPILANDFDGIIDLIKNPQWIKVEDDPPYKHPEWVLDPLDCTVELLTMSVNGATYIQRMNRKKRYNYKEDKPMEDSWSWSKKDIRIGWYLPIPGEPEELCIHRKKYSDLLKLASKLRVEPKIEQLLKSYSMYHWPEKSLSKDMTDFLQWVWNNDKMEEVTMRLEKLHKQR